MQLADVAAFPLILPSKETYMRRLLDRVLDRQGIKNLKVVMDIELFDTMHRGVRWGRDRPGSDADPAVERLLSGLRLRAVEPAPPPLPICMVTRKYAHQPAPVKDLQRQIARRVSA